MNGRNFKVGQRIIISDTMYTPDPVPRQSRWGGKLAEIVHVELHEDRLGWVTVICGGERLMLDEREVIQMDEKK